MGRFEQIYEEHQEALRVFVQRRAPVSIVDDVVSETFLVCWRKLERIPDEPLPLVVRGGAQDAGQPASEARARATCRRCRPSVGGRGTGAGWRHRPRRGLRGALGARSGSAAADCLGRTVAQPGGGRPRLLGACLPRPLPPRQDPTGATARGDRGVSTTPERSYEMTNDVIARLAAANPLPTAAPPRHPQPLVVPTRRIVLAVALMAAVALPAAAFAGKLGDLLGLSNEGTPVSTSSLDLSKDTSLNEAMQQLAFPSAMHLLGNKRSRLLRGPP